MKRILTMHKTRRLIPFMALLMIAVLLPSCSSRKKEIRDNIRAMTSHFITLPENMLVLEDGRAVSERDTASYRRQLIVWVSPSECSDCRISHLIDLNPVREELSKHPSAVMKVIFSPQEEDAPSLIRKIMSALPQGKIYVDSDCQFGVMNDFIPEDNRYHSFLIDENNVPILVGNPVASAGMMELFKKALE